jgi:cell division septum initiation protein DivIVA
MRSYEQLQADNKKLRQQLKKQKSEYQALKESADRFVLYAVGPHNARVLGLTNVKPMIINAGNKRIYPV